MPQNVTFLLGAGASFNAIPVVKKLNYRLEEFIETLTYVGIAKPYKKTEGKGPKIIGEIESDFVEHSNLKSEFTEKARRLLENIKDFQTIDTYAKKLYLQGDHDELSDLKLFLYISLLNS